MELGPHFDKPVHQELRRTKNLNPSKSSEAERGCNSAPGCCEACPLLSCAKASLGSPSSQSNSVDLAIQRLGENRAHISITFLKTWLGSSLYASYRRRILFRSEVTIWSRTTTYLRDSLMLRCAV